MKGLVRINGSKVLVEVDANSCRRNGDMKTVSFTLPDGEVRSCELWQVKLARKDKKYLQDNCKPYFVRNFEGAGEFRSVSSFSNVSSPVMMMSWTGLEMRIRPKNRTH